MKKELNVEVIISTGEIVVFPKAKDVWYDEEDESLNIITCEGEYITFLKEGYMPFVDFTILIAS